jgi:hypothetical protein
MFFFKFVVGRCFCVFVKKDKSDESLSVELFITGKPELLVNAEKNIKVTIENLGLKVFIFILIKIISGLIKIRQKNITKSLFRALVNIDSISG